MSTKVSKSDQPHVPVLGDEIAKLGPNPLQATVDRLRVSIAASRARCEALEADNRALRANLQRIELMIPTDRNERTGERGIFHDEQPDSPGGFLPCDCDELAEEILNYVRKALAPKEGNAP